MEQDIKNEEIMVSVFCTAYNHEKYIRQCLDGFVMQKTNFKFEVIVHDDASTDHTADIIREYEKKYPDIIKPIYQKENQYSKHVPITKTFILPKAKGKYVAVCEGDDYWCSEDKLQLQFDAMEENTNCRFCVHRTLNVSESGESLGYYYPGFDLKTTILSSKEYYRLTAKTYSFHTTSYFRRREDVLKYINAGYDFVKEIAKVGIGDEPVLLYWGQLGDIIYIDKVLSCYRRMSIGSWSQRRSKKSDEERLFHSKTFYNMLIMFDKFTEYKYHNELLYRMDSNIENILLEEGSIKDVGILYGLTKREYWKTRVVFNEKIYLITKVLCPFMIPVFKMLNKVIKKIKQW